MSITTIGADAWKAFWANLLAPGAFGIYLLAIVIVLGFGFAFNRGAGAFNLALRVVAALMSTMLLVGLLGAVGVTLGDWTPILNWLLAQIQAPLYLPEA